MVAEVTLWIHHSRVKPVASAGVEGKCFPNPQLPEKFILCRQPNTALQWQPALLQSLCGQTDLCTAEDKTYKSCFNHPVDWLIYEQTKLGLTTKDFKGLIPITGALPLFLFCFATILTSCEEHHVPFMILMLMQIVAAIEASSPAKEDEFLWCSECYKPLFKGLLWIWGRGPQYFQSLLGGLSTHRRKKILKHKNYPQTHQSVWWESR
jgi:hypothetical protein